LPVGVVVLGVHPHAPKQSVSASKSAVINLKVFFIKPPVFHKNHFHEHYIKIKRKDYESEKKNN
jgi:hypothetical protein